MPIIDNLALLLTAQTAGFDRPLNRSERNLNRFRRSAQSTGPTLTGLATRFAGISTGLIGLRSGFAFLNASLQELDRIGKLSTGLGETVENLQALRLGVELSGVSFESFTRGLQKLQQSIAEAGQGLSTPKRALEALNLSAEQLEFERPIEQIKLIAEELSKLPNQAAKSAAAAQLFGRAGRDLVVFLDGGAEGINNFVQQAERLGVVGEDSVRAVEEFNDSLTRLKTAIEVAAQEFITEFGPAITDYVNRLAFALGKTKDFVNGVRRLFGANLVEEVRNAAEAVARLEFQATFDRMSAAAAGAIGDVRLLSEEVRELGDSLELGAGAEAAIIFEAQAEQGLLIFQERLAEIKVTADQLAESLARVAAATQQLAQVEQARSSLRPTAEEQAGLLKQRDLLHEVIAGEKELQAGLRERIQTQKTAAGEGIAQIRDRIGALKEQQKLLQEGEKVRIRNREPNEIFNESLARLNELQKAGAISSQTHERELRRLTVTLDSASGSAESAADTLNKVREAQERRLISEARRITAQTRTPQELFDAEIALIEKLATTEIAAARISEETARRAKAAAKDRFEQQIALLERQGKAAGDTKMAMAELTEAEKKRNEGLARVQELQREFETDQQRFNRRIKELRDLQQLGVLSPDLFRDFEKQLRERIFPQRAQTTDTASTRSGDQSPGLALRGSVEAFRAVAQSNNRTQSLEQEQRDLLRDAVGELEEINKNTEELEPPSQAVRIDR